MSRQAVSGRSLVTAVR